MDIKGQHENNEGENQLQEQVSDGWGEINIASDTELQERLTLVYKG